MLKGQIHRNLHFIRSYLKKQHHKYEYVIINGGKYAGDMIDIIKHYGLKTVVIHHNFEREYEMDNKSILTLWGLSPYFIIRNERKAYLKSNIIVF